MGEVYTIKNVGLCATLRWRMEVWLFWWRRDPPSVWGSRGQQRMLSLWALFTIVDTPESSLCTVPVEQKHSALIQTWLFLNYSGLVDVQTLTTVKETRHDTQLHTIQLSNPSLFFPLSILTQHALAWGHIVIVPTFLFGDCVVGTLSIGSLEEAHNCWVWIFKKCGWMCRHWQLLKKHTTTLTSTPSNCQTLFFPPFNLHSARPDMRPYRDRPHLSLWLLCSWNAASLFTDRCPHFLHSHTICGLLSVKQLTISQPHNLHRERWGLSHYDLTQRREEWGLKEVKSERVLTDGVEVSVMGWS